MSERAAAAGVNGPAHTIEHDGTVYTVQPVITEGVMLAVEHNRYEKAKEALKSQQDMMSEAMYERKLDGLRQQYLDGAFSFESEDTMKFLNTKPGVIVLLCAMMNCNQAAIMKLLTERTVEMQSIMQTVLAISFPKPTGEAKKGRRGHR